MPAFAQKAASIASASFGVISASAVIVALFCSLLLKFAHAWMAMGIPFGFLIVIAAAIPLLNYLFEIIEYRALGRPGWPVLSVETVFAFRSQIGLIFVGVVFVAALLRAMLVAGGQPALGDLFSMFVLFAVPVSVAVLAVTRQIAKSINPIFLLRTVVRLELGYLAILVLSALWWLIARQALGTRAFLWILATTLTLLMLGYCIGSIVFAYRRRLGLESVYAPEARLAAEQAEIERKRSNALTTAWSLASRGNVSGAIGHICEYSREETDSLAAENSLFHRMARWPEPVAAIRFGAELAPRLAAAGRDRDAAKVDVVCEALREAGRRAAAD